MRFSENHCFVLQNKERNRDGIHMMDSSGSSFIVKLKSIEFLRSPQEIFVAWIAFCENTESYGWRSLRLSDKLNNSCLL